ncbi:hypothetical protein [Pseudomonas shirazensis]|uniref:hypothetical protein n=1 Tax=Pseudomonas shirazensis TaxID=2745494 RepID=UPI00398868DB
MTIYTLRLITTSTYSPEQMQAAVVDALGTKCERLRVKVHQVSKEGLEIEVKGERKPLDAAHMLLSQDFAAEHPFVRVLDQLGDALRNEAYPLLGRLEQELRAFINEAMIAAGLGIDWLTRVDDARISSRVLATLQKGQSAIYQHPVEFTELDHLLEIVTLDLAAWAEQRSITAHDLLSLLEVGTDLKDVRATLAERMKKRSFWDVVFSPFFDDLPSWQSWKSRWKKEVIGLRNRVMHHRPVFAWEIEKLRVTAVEFTTLLNQHRKRLSMRDKESIRQSAQELMATFHFRRDLHEALGGSRLSGISIANESNAIFLFCIDEPETVKTVGPNGSEELLVRYQGGGRTKEAILVRENRALCNHVVEGREVQMFVSQPRGRGIYHLGQAEYRRHAHYDNHDGTLCVMFELALTPSPALLERLNREAENLDEAR